MSGIEEKVKLLVAPIAKKYGCEVVDVEYKKQSTGMNLTVFIDKPNGVSLDDCEKVHMAIDEPLDELDPTNGASYILNVSSPGLDRNLASDEALLLAVGGEVDIKLYSQIDKKKAFEGAILVSFDKECIVIDGGEKQLEIPRKQISKITKHINF